MIMGSWRGKKERTISETEATRKNNATYNWAILVSSGKLLNGLQDVSSTHQLAKDGVLVVQMSASFVGQEATKKEKNTQQQQGSLLGHTQKMREGGTTDN